LGGEFADRIGLLVFVPEGRDRAEDPLALFGSLAGRLDCILKGLGEGRWGGGGVLYKRHIRYASRFGAPMEREKGP
jgi:hypothetical protein